jgi:hypothetical protein
VRGAFVDPIKCYFAATLVLQKIRIDSKLPSTWMARDLSVAQRSPGSARGPSPVPAHFGATGGADQLRHFAALLNWAITKLGLPGQGPSREDHRRVSSRCLMSGHFRARKAVMKNAEEPLFNLLTTVDTTNFVIVLPESIVI